MKAAITVWGERVSPVFDSAQTLLIAEIGNGRVTGKRYEPFDPDLPHRLIERLAELGVDVLLCGAISTIPSNTIELSGMRLISFISGDVEEILQAYAAGKPLIPEYLMPGCRCRYKQQRNMGASMAGRHSGFRRGPGCSAAGNGAVKRGSGAGSGRRRTTGRQASSKKGQFEWKNDSRGKRRRGGKTPGSETRTR